MKDDERNKLWLKIDELINELNNCKPDMSLGEYIDIMKLIIKIEDIIRD